MRADDPRHGQNRGYIQHQRDGEEPCRPCADAHAYYQRHRDYDKQRGRRRIVPTVGLVRRVRALRRIGWSTTMIAQEAGWKFAESLQYPLRNPTCNVATFNRVAEVYDRLSTKPAPFSSASVRTTRRAERLGHPPPSAWFGVDIDDPAAEPDPGWSPAARTSGVAVEVLLEDFDWLVEQGESEDRAAARLGVKLHTVRDTRRRLERKAS